jgi:hypothetical protein
MLPTQLLSFCPARRSCVRGSRPLQTAQRTGHPLFCLCQRSQNPGPPAQCGLTRSKTAGSSPGFSPIRNDIVFSRRVGGARCWFFVRWCRPGGTGSGFLHFYPALTCAAILCRPCGTGVSRFPQRLKPDSFLWRFAARLKPCPSRARSGSESKATDKSVRPTCDSEIDDSVSSAENSRFPSASSGRALTGLSARLGMTSLVMAMNCHRVAKTGQIGRDRSATLAAMTTQTIPEYLEEERQKAAEAQTRTEEEAARIQPLQHGHHRRAKQPKELLPPVKAVTKKKKKKKAAAVDRKKPRASEKMPAKTHKRA